MGCFEDLDDGLLKSVLKWLNSTELRSGACLVCKRWLSACNSRPALWRDLDINAPWEVYRSQILRSAAFRAPYRVLDEAGGSSSSSSRGGRVRSSTGHFPSGRHGFWAHSRPNRPAFLSRDAISRWLQRRAPCVEVLRVSHTEQRISVVGYGSGAGGRHDLQPSDLMAMLAAMPALTELHLISACNLLPDISVLLNLPPPPPPASTPPTPVAPDVDADGMSRLPPPAPTPLRPLPAALPLSQRLRRLSLCRGGYQFDTQEGSAQVEALGALHGLHELSITLEPATMEGLGYIPEEWSALTGLTALHLGGHQRLGELPSWVSYRLPHLRELTLESCGLRRVPYKAVSGLRELRLLSMDRCPLGHAGVVSLDAWLPPQMEENGCGMAAVEVLQLRNCNIVALPYTMTRLTNLRRLDLGGNPLGNLAQPEVSYRHRNMGAAVLRYLKESGDRGFSELVCLTRLGHLGLQGCGLGTLPLGVADLTQLTSLDLSGNPELELNSGRVADLLAGQLPQLESLRLVETSAGEQLRDQQDLNLHHGLRTLILE